MDQRKLNKSGNVHVTLRCIRSTVVAVEKKTIRITYFECVLVALDIQVAMHTRHTLVCGLPGSTVYFHTIT